MTSLPLAQVGGKQSSGPAMFGKELLPAALKDSLAKLRPSKQWRNPVMFLVYVGAIGSTIAVVADIVAGNSWWFSGQITLWLWITVLFANFAEAIAEGRGKAQADSLKRARTNSTARRIIDSNEERIAATDLKKGDIVVCESGDVIPGDGEVVEGIASVDESAITGESAPVIRESGGDRSAVTGGTKVISDRILIRITAEQGSTFLDRMIALIEGASRRKTPNEIALTILLAALSIIFLVAVTTLPAFDYFSRTTGGSAHETTLTIPVLIALLVCLIPTTIGGLLSAIGISGMDRLLRRNVVAKSGRAVESAGDIDVLLLDKTGTITLGNRMAADFIPADGITAERLAHAAQLSSLADETPEGRSVVVLAKEQFNLRARDITPHEATFVEFTAQTRMSGVDLQDNGRTISYRKGAADSIEQFVRKQGGIFPESVRRAVPEIAKSGGTPLVVAEGAVALGVIYLKDVVKGGIRERFEQLRRMGIRTVMITGDNPLTAAAIAAEAGVDDFVAEATPETKLQRIREEQAAGRMVAMIGDGTNDAPALAQADVGVAMNTGTQAAREAGNMVDLDSNPTKLIEVVETGKQLLMTRGALTTFSIANDVAKYFAILPALFGGLYAAKGMSNGPLSSLNVMGLSSPESAVLSAVIFNALIIVALVPLALRGVAYRPLGASAILRRNLIVYGGGGLIVPFIGIKLIDIFVSFLLHLS